MEHGSSLLDVVTERQSGRSIDDRAITRTANRELSKHRSTARDAEITVDAALFLRAVLGCIGMLVVLGLLAAYLGYIRNADGPSLILRAFLLDEETNVPTFFVFGLLGFCSVLLTLIAGRAVLLGQDFRVRWALLAALFLLVAYDEAAMLHERLNDPVRAALGGSGFTYFGWVIPAAGLVAGLTLIYLPFLRGLPAPFGRLFLLSGALYVGGALGVEMLGAAYYEANSQTFTYHLFTTAEETLEMLGVAVFAYALLRFLARREGSVRIGFRAG